MNTPSSETSIAQRAAPPLPEEHLDAETDDVQAALLAEEDEQPPAAPRTAARTVAEQVLAWAAEHHLVDPLVVTGQSVSAEGPSDNTLFPQHDGNTLLTLRTKQIGGVIYNEAARTVYVLMRRRIGKMALKSMPMWHSGVAVKYLNFGQAQAGTQAQPPDGPSYREVNDGRYCCGSSIHPARYPGAGTIGALLADPVGTLYGLTANHVSGLGNYADSGEKILAPGHSDITPAGRDPFTIGVHFKALPMNPGSPTNVDIQQNTDAAVFAIRSPDQVSSSQGGYFDTPDRVAEPIGDMRVEKVGRTTGYTIGKIIGVAPGPMAVGYNLAKVGGNATVYFNQLLMVFGDNGTPFSAPGDSGALVVGQDAEGHPCAVGMVIAGTNTGYSLILPLSPILQSLNMRLVSRHNA